MKKLFVLTYIIAVLLFAGFARAEDLRRTQLQILNIAENDNSRWTVHITGPLKNLCVRSPEAVLVQSEREPHVFILKVTARVTGELCAQAIAGPYSLKPDLRVLLQQTGAELVPNHVYMIKADGYPFEMQFTGADALVSQIDGILTADLDGQPAIITENSEVVLIDDSLVDLQNFMNRNVSLIGLYGPLQDDQGSVDPSNNRRTLPVLPTHGLTVIEIQPLVR